MASQLEGSLQFIAGIYYENFEDQDDTTINWFGSQESLEERIAASGWGIPAVNPIWFQDEDSELTQKALFGELVYTLNEKWAFALGSRWFDYDRTDAVGATGAFPSSFVEVNLQEKGSVFKFNASYTPSEDSLIYAQWSQGFRIGEGVNPESGPPADICDVDGDGLLDHTGASIIPEDTESDSTNNFELGSKFSFLDQRLTVNAALYYIEWEDLPVDIVNTTDACAGGFSVTLNGGEARSQGVELETQYYVTPQLQLSLSAGYTDAEFVSKVSGGAGEVGERLPVAPKFNGSLGLEYQFKLAGYDAFIRSDYTYVGGYYSYPNSHSAGPQGTFPESGDYGKLNLRTGIAIDQFTVDFYGTNLTDEDAFSHVQAGGAYRIAPRVFGVDVGYRF